MTEYNTRWTYLVPIASAAVLVVSKMASGPVITAALVAGLVGSVVAAVHHAEVIASRVGEPFGTLVLALSVTVIELALIVSMMLSGGPDAMTLPRDTIFAAVMIILNGIIGASLWLGGFKNHIQTFNAEGLNAALCTTAAILVLSMVIPNFTQSAAGPVYTSFQLGFVAVTTIALFATFTLYQTVWHRDYFIPEVDDASGAERHEMPTTRTALISLLWLVISLVCVVLSAKGISPTLEASLGRWGAPAATLGIIIAAIVLLPETGAALRAAYQDRLQSSLNLALGSAIASIGLTVPAVAVLAIYMDWPLEMGLSPMSMILLGITLFMVSLSLRSGETTRQSGVTHVMLFIVYLFFSFVP